MTQIIYINIINTYSYVIWSKYELIYYLIEFDK